MKPTIRGGRGGKRGHVKKAGVMQKPRGLSRTRVAASGPRDIDGSGYVDSS